MACWGEYSREPPHQDIAVHPIVCHWSKDKAGLNINIVNVQTVVVTANIRRRSGATAIITWTVITTITKIVTISVSPDVFTRSTTICDRYTINICIIEHLVNKTDSLVLVHTLESSSVLM